MFSCAPFQNFVIFHNRRTTVLLKNEKIIDPFSGSGTVPLVCAINKRQYLGIEKDKEYHKISIKRLKNLK